nr:EOG090X00J5 [Eulimnadia texana]
MATDVSASRIDDLVQKITFHIPYPLVFHGYVLPFLFLYSVWFYLWVFIYGVEEYYEAGWIALAVIALIQVLVSLFCHWSVHIRVLLTCSTENDPSSAVLAKVVPTPNNGSPELVKLYKDKDSTTGKVVRLWLTFQKTKYIWDFEKKQFHGVQFPIDRSHQEYLEWRGYQDEKEVQAAEKEYGKNELEMVVPEFMELFKERATAPFFVFQVFCVGLWCLDAYWYYSVFTLFMLVTFECTLVQQQLRNMSEIRKMGNKPRPIQVYRCKKWQTIKSDQLVPGDIVSIGRLSEEDSLVPCDLLLLRGPCIVDESLLTGESVPQMKEPLENVEWDPNSHLDIEEGSKLHLLYGGTRIVQHTSPAKGSGALKAPDGGCIAYVLRNGFSTAQGKLLRTILFGVKRVTANNLETFGFILFLLFFAILASGYLWIKGTEDPNRNRYKLFLECTLILTSVVPPELPIELSLAVNTSLLSLSKLAVFCTEPFRIPFAGKVEICCFDKTGTLTTDNLVVEGVAGLNEGDGTSSGVSRIEDVPVESLQVMATCHSLVHLEDGLVGDPLEKATLTAIDWTLTKGDAVIPNSKKVKSPGLKIVQRYHFTSALKRMSVIASYSTAGSSENKYLATIKGAPETLKPMFADLPENYDQIYLENSRKGARVLALGYKQLDTSQQNVRHLKREDLESGLTFAGFLILSCPLKRDSLAMIKEIVSASHRVVMITGDNPLTACHVAKVLKFCVKEHTLTLVSKDGDWVWESVDQTVTVTLEESVKDAKKFVSSFDLCLTGEGVTHLRTRQATFFMRVLPYVRVYARVNPKQKELVVTSLNGLGYTTLMCGDGTNDVGALKHAHVGVAILSHAQDLSSHKKKKQQAEENDAAKTKEKEKEAEAREKMSRKVAPRPGVVPRPTAGEDPRLERLNRTRQKLEQLMKEMEEQEKAQLVKLGDASIAAPFTSKMSSIQSICHVIKQGRCTLVTTLQMFKILALNALILAYSQSVLYLKGVKFSDGQATLQGLLLAACFLFISRSKPLKYLSKQRPLPNIFNAYTVLTVMLQFAIHFVSLVYLVNAALDRTPGSDAPPDLEKEFEPNLLNSCVYIISMALQVSTIAVNYRGHPFMESLMENRALLYSLVGSGAFILSLALGIFPEINAEFSIVDFDPEFRNILTGVLLVDFTLAFVIDRICLFVLGEGSLKIDV